MLFSEDGTAVSVLGTVSVFCTRVFGTRYCFGIPYEGLRYSVFRWSCNGQVLTAYAVQVAGIVVRYAVYPPSTPARSVGGVDKCSCTGEARS